MGKNLKETHPDIFRTRQDGLELRGFGDGSQSSETIDGFYRRLRLANRNEQPPLQGRFEPFQNAQFEGDIWYKKDDWHFVARSTALFPHSDRNWGLIELDPWCRVLFTPSGFQSQQPRTHLEQQIADFDDAGDDNSSELDQLYAQAEAQPPQCFINRLSLGVHPARTTLVLTYLYNDYHGRYDNLVVSEE